MYQHYKDRRKKQNIADNLSFLCLRDSSERSLIEFSGDGSFSGAVDRNDFWLRAISNLRKI